MQRQYLILLSLFLAAGFVALVAFSHPTSNRSASSATANRAASTRSIPQNGFKDDIAIEKPNQVYAAPGGESEVKNKNIEYGETSILGPDVAALQDLIPDFLPPTNEEIFALPGGDGDIAIEKNGYGARDYLAYIASNSGEIDFDFQKIKTILGTDTSVKQKSPAQLIQDVLDGKRTNIDDSLAIYRELAQRKIDFETKIAVNNADGKIAARLFVGLDKLVIAQIDAFSKFKKGDISRVDFQKDLSKYITSEKFYLSDLQQTVTGEPKVSSAKAIIESTLEALGVVDIVRAIVPVPLGFGGLITLETPCSCVPGSTEIIVGPPKGGSFIIPPFMILYSTYQPFPGHYILGLFTPGPLPCFGVFPACIPSSEGAVIMAGTSGI